MAAYEIEFKPRVERELGRLPFEVISRFERAFALLVEDPRRPRAGLDVRPLEGSRAGWRLRVGRYRAIYEVQGSRILITRIAHRSVVYRP